MGFRFRVVDIGRVYNAKVAGRLSRELREVCGTEVPLGRRGTWFSADGDLGWEWWNELRAFARKELGTNKTPHLHAIDAWHGVYVDAPIHRAVLWPGGPADEKRRFEAPKPAKDPEANALCEMFIREIHRCGPRVSEEEALQVGCLRGLKTELDRLVTCVGLKRDAEYIDAKRWEYSLGRLAPDHQPHLHILCHAWLSAHMALALRAPMWLLKT